MLFPSIWIMFGSDLQICSLGTQLWILVLSLCHVNGCTSFQKALVSAGMPNSGEIERRTEESLIWRAPLQFWKTCLHCAYCSEVSCQLLFPDVQHASGENHLREGMDPLGLWELVVVVRCVFQVWLHQEEYCSGDTSTALQCRSKVWKFKANSHLKAASPVHQINAYGSSVKSEMDFNIGPIFGFF